jgi:tRNA pseudouridine55 synthase
VNGLLVIDKPAGPTSHDVVTAMRRVLGERRIGHTGTLDPAATGVLPLVIGRATRLAQFMSAADKAYDAEIRLGFATETDDGEGRPIGSAFGGPWPAAEEIERVIASFRGTFEQRPPAFSARKTGGRRSYTLARNSSGAEARLPAPSTVTVHALHLIEADGNRLVLRIECSAGFYVRSLAREIGERLGTGGHLASLRRTRSGDVALIDALPLDIAARDRESALRAIVPIARMLPSLPAVVLDDEAVQRALHGRNLVAAAVVEGHAPAAPVRLLDGSGNLLGIGREMPGGLLHPVVILR